MLDGPAALDRSHLIGANEWGEPLFRDVTNRVLVHVYEADVRDPRTRQAVTAFLQRNVPAHVAHTLRVIEARMTVGFQCRLGVDTVIGDTAATALRLGTALGPDVGAAPGDPIDTGAIGPNSTVGQDTFLL